MCKPHSFFPRTPAHEAKRAPGMCGSEDLSYAQAYKADVQDMQAHPEQKCAQSQEPPSCRATAPLTAAMSGSPTAVCSS